MVAVMVFAIFMSTSCRKTEECGLQTSKSFSVKDVTEIKVDGDLNVILSQADSTYMIAEGCNADLKNIETLQDQGVLKITRKTHKQSEPVILKMALKDFTALHTDGVVKVEASGFQNKKERILEARGTSRINFNGNASNLNLFLDGTASIEPEGESETIALRMKGVTKYKGYKMTTSKCNVQIEGDAKASILVKALLDGSASGTSEIRYKGDAEEKVVTRELAKIIKE